MMTIFVTLGIWCFLAVPVSAWAGEHVWDTTTPGCKMFQKHDFAKVERICDGDAPSGNKEIISCDESGKACEIRDPSKFPCYQKMREAIRKINTVIVRSGKFDDVGVEVAITHLWIAKHLQPVMKECVE